MTSCTLPDVDERIRARDGHDLLESMSGKERRLCARWRGDCDGIGRGSSTSLGCGP